MPDIIERRKLIAGLNGDTDPMEIPDGQLINGFNFRSLTSEDGSVEGVQSIRGTTQLFNPMTSGINYAIGWAEDEAGARLVEIGWNANGSFGIYARDLMTGTQYTVLLNSQVTGGLGLDKNSLCQCASINGMFYWTNNLNAQRRINISAAINLNHPGTYPGVTAYASPLEQSVISLIRNPPAYTIVPQKQYDSTVIPNFTQNEAFLFAYYYQYRDFEISKLSPFSRLINYNYDGENWNNVGLTIPLDEIIQQDVLRINIAVLYLNTNKAFVIKTWDKNISVDAAEIAAHNAGTTALNYDFFNDRIGIALDTQGYVNIPFDAVPVLSKSIEVAKDRLHLANNLEGYDTPLQSSLTVEVVDSGTSGVDKIGYDTTLTYREITGGPPNFNDVRVWLLFMTELTPQGYYAVVSTEQIAVGGPPPSPAALPATLVVADLAFRGADQTAVIAYYDGLFVNFAPVAPLTFDQPGDSTTVTDISADTFIPFKSDSPYQAGIVFYDAALRKCGLFTRDDLIAQIPDRDYALTSVASLINWSLSNASAASEIPLFGVYYQIVISKNLATRFFQQAVTDQIIYARKDANGDYDLNASYTTLVPASVALAVSLDYLATYGMGYTFTNGDIIKIYRSSPATVFRLRVNGVSGKYLIAQLTDIGNTSAVIYLYEIRTPYQRADNEPMYENGQLYKINNPGTVSREYNTLTGTLNGDVYLRTRTHNAVDYFTEAMSPQDLLWQNWNTDASRTNVIDKIGQRRNGSSGRFSNTIIEGSQINGLSTFEALNKYKVTDECGEINRIILTSKVSDEPGVVMLALCRSEAVSIYLGEQQLTAAAGKGPVSVSDSVVGTINPLKGSQGTINPESVVAYNGLVFWYNAIKGTVCQYSVNGIDIVSNYDMITFWRRWSLKYVSMTQGDIEALGSRPFVFGGIDPFNGEYLLSIPKLEDENPSGFLPGAPIGAPENLFNIYDGAAKTMVYKYNANRWMPATNATPEMMAWANNQLFGWKFGIWWLHNDNALHGSFYGATYPCRVMIPSNYLSEVPKIVKAINAESNQVPSAVYIYVIWPNEQITDLDNTLFTNLEGVFYSAVYRDRLSPAYAGDFDRAWASGDKMRSKVAMIELDFTGGTEMQLEAVNVITEISKGHRTLPEQKQ